jgi:hypothetical protein
MEITPVTNEKRMLGYFHERQMKTLEQGINDIHNCVRHSRLFVLFLYDEEQIVCGKITFMNNKYMTIKYCNYYYDKIPNIYSYFTLQKLDNELLRIWYDEPE